MCSCLARNVINQLSNKNGREGVWTESFKTIKLDMDMQHCTKIRLYHPPLTYLTGEEGHLYQTFDSCQMLSKVVFDLRQMQYAFDLYQSYRKVTFKCASKVPLTTLASHQRPGIFDARQLNCVKDNVKCAPTPLIRL